MYGKKGRNKMAFSLYTVGVSQKKKQPERKLGLVRVQGATCGLTLPHLGCQSGGRRGHLSPPGPLPAVLMNLLRPWEWLMHLFIG